MTDALLPMETRSNVEIAITRIREYYHDEPWYVAFSGGKDSQAIYHLAQESGVPYNAHFNIDLSPPEHLQFIRRNYPAVKWERKQGFNFYAMVASKGFPIRQKRWCCEYMKEWGGENRYVITGVRWQESSRRKNTREIWETDWNGKKAVLNPIIDWSEADVWNYLRARSIPHSPLYDEGFKRIGCVLCPMAGTIQKHIELERWPKIADAYRSSFHRLWELRIAQGKDSCTKRWKDADEMFWWYINEPDGVPDEQMAFDLDFESDLKEE